MDRTQKRVGHGTYYGFHLALLLVFAASAGAEARYIVLDLGTLGGSESIPQDINDACQVAGRSSTADGDWHIFLWAADTGMQDLGTLGGSGPGWTNVHAINEAGQVVGMSEMTDGNFHAFFWEEGKGMQDIGTLGGDNSFANDINEAGQVVGAAQTAEGDYHPFLWEEGEGMQDLGTFGGAFNYAEAINEVGQVAGQGRTEDDQRYAFLWEEASGLQNLGNLGGQRVVTYDMNDGGQIVGWSETADGERHAFLWEEGESMQDLGTLGGDNSNAWGINEAGQVIGTSHTVDVGEPWGHAILWMAGSGMQDLGTLYEGGYSAATNINEAGQVVGWAEDSVGNRPPFLWEAETGMRDLNDLILDDGSFLVLEAYSGIDINEAGWIICTGDDWVSDQRAVLLKPLSLASFQPDLWVKQSSSWLGDDIYNADATDQTANRPIGSGQTRVYRARMYNDSDTAETFWLHGSEGNADWTVQYYWGTSVNPAREVTAKVTSTNGWRRANVPPDGRRNFLIVVTPAPGVLGSFPVQVTATSDSDPDQIDCIQAITTVPNVQPDLHIKKGPVWGGDDIYNDDGTDQKGVRKVLAGASAIFRAYVQNDGDEAETFKIFGPAGDADWEVQYYWGKKVDAAREVTANVTSPSGWARPNVPPGNGRYFLIVVTPNSGLPADSKYVALVRAEARRDASQRDTIKMTTKVKAE